MRLRNSLLALNHRCVIHRVIIAGELPKPDDVKAEYSVVNDENATPTATQPDNEDDDARVINWLVDEGN